MNCKNFFEMYEMVGYLTHVHPVIAVRFTKEQVGNEDT